MGHHGIIGALIASLAGIPLITASYLRLKYGPTVFQDLMSIRQGLATKKLFDEMHDNHYKLIDCFEEHARSDADHAFVLHNDEVHTYGSMDSHSNQLAHFIQRNTNITKEYTAAIFMMNDPDFVLTWLAYNKLGLRIAFFNYNVRGAGLLHCIASCNVKIIACGKDSNLLEALESISSELKEIGVQVLVFGNSYKQLPVGDFMSADFSLESTEPMARHLRDEVDYDDDALYIFTSGTTGFPKPAKIPHTKQVRASFFHKLFDISKDDVMYTPIPLYHSGGFLVGFVNVLRVGGAVALQTFSVRRFWDDVRKHRATVIQYIGETCRYLLSKERSPDDGKYSHKIRYAVGNGLRPDIWEEFKSRFNIGRIAEFYGMTEGTHGTVNTDGKLGAVGRQHGILQALSRNIIIVKCDVETAQPLRDAKGLCIIAKPDETGLALSQINENSKFFGYRAMDSANEKKMARNVMKQNDMYFNTGDLLSQDKDGYFYFKDRLGDTFRWKGENVATTEVAQILNVFQDIDDANVYGVKVPGSEGRAGMASIVLSQGSEFNPKDLFNYVVSALPLYACPKFLRISGEISTTATFKHLKSRLVQEGFDLNLVTDPMYFMDMELRTYSPLDNNAVSRITTGQARL